MGFKKISRDKIKAIYVNSCHKSEKKVSNEKLKKQGLPPPSICTVLLVTCCAIIFTLSLGACAFFLMIMYDNIAEDIIVNIHDKDSFSGKDYDRANVYSHFINKFTFDETFKKEVKFTTTHDTSHTKIINKIMSCYYNLPSDYKNLNLLQPSMIHPHLCTHINIAFATIVNKTLHINENIATGLALMYNLKKINPDLKILISIGGAGNDNGFSEMVVDHAARKEFIRSVMDCLHAYNIDGIDLDWEFPALHNAGRHLVTHRERQHFSQLLYEIRKEYNRHKHVYLLSVAVAAPQVIVDNAYDIDQLNLYADYMNVMTYDFHHYTSVTPFTGLNSPLFARKGEQYYFSTLNINYTVHMYIDKGLSRDKIVIGIPTYGHSFHLVNVDNAGLNSPASGYGSLGNLGFVSYPTVCKFMYNFSKEVVVNNETDAKVPYLHKDHEWVSYDDQYSVMEKAKYIKDNGLRGAMVYSLNTDDYHGMCQLHSTMKFPLVNSIKNELTKKN